MMKNKFDKIIDFAIKGEQDAVDFYRDLQTKVKFKAQKTLLKEYEEMEKGHITILKNMKTREFKGFKLKEVQDLKISDYMVEKEPEDDMDYQDILIIAMKREEAATKLYKDLSEQVDDTDAKRLFLKLSQEEAEHKLKFETLYDEEILKEN